MDTQGMDKPQATSPRRAFVVTAGSVLGSLVGCAAAPSQPTGGTRRDWQPDGTVTIRKGDDLTTVIERFAVPPDRQAGAIDAVMKAAALRWKADAQLIGFVVLRGREKSGGVALYSQWVRKPQDAAAAAPTAERSMRDALKEFEVLDSENLQVAFTAQAPSLPSVSLASLASTPHAHFGLFRVAPANMDELIRRAETTGPNSFRVRGLRSINFHRGASGRFVVNFGLWETFDHFKDLHDAPGFALKNQYYVGLADFQPDFFDVVAVVSR